ncbi:MAG: hypothetical protein LAP38_18850 [Acidobacteriia bacterium]|nr:hypothetical protein [Terriglobia bacterium]
MSRIQRRNSLEYSVAPGASYWRYTTYRAPAAAFAAGPKITACQAFVRDNEKARLQIDLEERFRMFEESFAAMPATAY